MRQEKQEQSKSRGVRFRPDPTFSGRERTTYAGNKEENKVATHVAVAPSQSDLVAESSLLVSVSSLPSSVGLVPFLGQKIAL